MMLNKTKPALLALLLLGLALTACGRKPSDVDMPADAARHTYPPVEQSR